MTSSASPLPDYRRGFESLAEWITHRNSVGVPQAASTAQALVRLRSRGFHFGFLNEHAAPEDVAIPEEVTGLREGLVYKGLNSRHRAVLDGY